LVCGRDALSHAVSAALRSPPPLTPPARANPAATEPHQSAASALAGLRSAYTQTAYRPAGPTRRHRALAQLVTELERARYFAISTADQPMGANPCLAEGNLLASAVVSVFNASAEGLKGGPAPDLHSLEQARIAHRNALDAWAGTQLRSGASVELVLDGLDYDHRLRVLSYLCLATGANAAIVAGRDFEPGSVRIPFGTPIEAGFRPALRRVGQTLMTHLS